MIFFIKILYLSDYQYIKTFLYYIIFIKNLFLLNYFQYKQLIKLIALALKTEKL